MKRYFRFPFLTLLFLFTAALVLPIARNGQSKITPTPFTWLRRPLTIFTAPSGPITAISAIGQAKFASVRMCLLDITH